MHITLLADGNTKSAIYELDFDGHVTAQKNPFRKQTGINVLFNWVWRDKIITKEKLVNIYKFLFWVLITEPSGVFPTKNRNEKCNAEGTFEKHGDAMGDEEEDLSLVLQSAKAYSTAGTTTWPSERYAYVKFGYDNTLLNQLTSDGTTFAAWIDSVMTHVQTYYKHSSLPTQILFKVFSIIYINK